MLNIGKKKYRNLQEQVGYNTKEIEKIFSILDGIDYEDHVVVIQDISIPLTQEEMAIVVEPVSFLVYGEKLYFKDSADENNLYFSAVINLEGTDLITLNLFKIAVSISNGEMSIVDEESTVYSSTKMDEKIANLNTLISNLADGSPKGVYATLADLQTAYPTGAEGIYLVSENGHWYYWSGSAWTDGGAYLSASNIDTINVPFTATSGYIGNIGQVNAHAILYHTDEYIEVSEGETIEVTNISAESNTYAAFYDANKIFLTNRQLSVYVDNNTLILTAPYGAKYFRTTLTSGSSNIYILKTRYQENIELTSKDNNYYRKVYPDITWKKYLGPGGTPVTLNQNYGVTDFIFVNPKEKIIIKKHISVANMYYAFYTKDKRTLSVIQTTNLPADDPLTLTVPDNAQYIRLTVHTQISVPGGDWTNVKRCLEEIIVEEYQSYREIIFNQIDEAAGIDILSSFNNITCAGDSLTYGLVYTQNGSRRAYRPYPKVLELKTGSAVENISISGVDALGWWNNFNANIVNKTNQLFIVYLGTNSGLTDTLDTDAPSTEPDYNNWSATNTGSYAKIVAKAKDVGARVLLIKVYSTEGNLTTTNNVIDQIATRFGCAVVDAIPLPLKYHYYPDYSGSNGVHFNDLGYCAFAVKLMHKVSVLDSDKMKLIIPD